MIKKIKDKILIKWKKYEQSPSCSKCIRWLVCIINLALLVYFLLPSFTSHERNLSIGDIAPIDIHATRNFPIIDEESTEKRKKIEIEEVIPIFDIDMEIIEKNQNKINKFFNALKEIQINYPAFQSNKDSSKFASRKNNKNIYREFEKIKDDYYLPISREILMVLLEYAYKNDEYETFNSIKKNISLITKEAMFKGIMVNKDAFPLSSKNKIEIHYSNRSKAVIVNISEVFDEKEAGEAIRNDANQLFPDDHRIANLIFEISVCFIKPNLNYNIDKTKAKKSEISASIEPIYSIVKKGEIVIREGDRINEMQYGKYKALIEYESKIRLSSIISRVLIVIIFIFLTYYYLSRQYPKVFYNNSLLILITIVFNLSIIIQKIIYHLNFPIYFIPIGFMSMLFSILINPRIAFYFTSIMAIIIGIIMDDSLSASIIFFTLGSTGIISMTRIRDRISITNAFIYVSIINAFTIFSLNLYDMVHPTWDKMLNIFWGGANGLAAASLASILLPPLESLFNITTDVKLLELSDLNHPLLKKFSIEAPGSYQHSIIVGNLAESASQAIGANALFARVSSYYHDIGKMTKPEYFVENFMGSKHDNLSSTLSTLIITSHIKDGVELAEKYKLPQVIIDIIIQHHGTSLIQYFYQRALNEEDIDKTGEVNEYEYRYDGPKPQTKEAAIVMLADSLEAASRVLKDKNISRIRGLIKNIIESRLVDGQFEECDITLNDLKKIADEFEKNIVSMLHNRIDYEINESQGKK